jgi:2-oxoisovalerate ferredoxin oxidoreductase beta subunit
MSTTTLYKPPESFFRSFDRKGGEIGTTHYCPGCGHGVVHKMIAEAIDDLGVQDRTVLISSVGCSVFAYYYFDVGNIQVAHGRSPAAATGVKRALPHSLVIGYQGDGDLAAIGCSEIVHAANRGENITVFFLNNAIYGMTGGQMAPTSVEGMQTTTTPRGRSATNEGLPLRICELLSTLDAPYYLERVAVGNPKQNRKARSAVRKALRYQLENRGFSLVEVLSPCPTGWKLTPVEAARWATEVMPVTFPLGIYRDGHELDLGHPRLRRQPAEERIPELLGIADGTEIARRPRRESGTPEVRVKISGFGGQGILLVGTLLAQTAMQAGRRVAWVPSYGPEMRGGTAFCSVTLSDLEIGCPVIEHPTVLVAMNAPSLQRYGPDVEPGGVILFNASMVSEPLGREDVQQLAVPATEIADRVGETKVANMVLVGAMLARAPTGLSREQVLAALPAVLKGRPELLEPNRRAIEAGLEWAAREAGSEP